VPRERAVYRPMTESEKTLARAFARVSTPTISFARRFAQAIGSETYRDLPQISDRQLNALRMLVRKYRRQISSDRLDEADRWLLDPEVPLPEAPLLPVRSDGNGSRSAEPSRDATGQPDGVEASRAQLPLFGTPA
jgi:hypothetical protein